MAEKTAPLGPFLGMNNRLPDHALGVTERGRKSGDYLRNAVNADITDAGTLLRRAGSTLVMEGGGCHSLWADGEDAFFVDTSTLYRITESGGALTKTAIRSGLVPGARASFERAARGDIYWTNGNVIERIRGGASEPVGVPVPPQPVVSASSGGSLPEGRYMVCVTRVAPSGEMSGSSAPEMVSVPENGAIGVTGIASGGYAVRVYMTPTNGTDLYLVQELPSGQTTFSIPAMPPLRNRCETLFMRQMPAGHVVRDHGGRLLVAQGATLFYSEPHAHGLHNPARGYIPLPDRIAVVRPCGGGVFVATTDKTYWLAGADIDACQVSEVLPYGAVENSDAEMPNSESVWWQSARGKVIGSPSGEVRNTDEGNVAVDSAGSGASLYVERNGIRQMLSALFKPTGFSTAVAGSFMQMEVIRKEEVL